MSVTLQEHMDSMEIKPDGFKLTLVYWGREPVDPNHPIHMLLEMLKHQFNMEVKKTDVVVRKQRFWQADLIWSGDEKTLVARAQELDDILQKQLPTMAGRPEFNFDTWNFPPSDEDSEF